MLQLAEIMNSFGILNLCIVLIGILVLLNFNISHVASWPLNKIATNNVCTDHTFVRKINKKSPLAVDTNNGLLETDDKVQLIVIVLVGIPGSGKSTLAQYLSKALTSYQPTLPWRVFNQDVLKSRQRVYFAAEESLKSNTSVIIDRCNFDNIQRSHWIKLANAFSASTICIELPHSNNIELCSTRAFSRGNDGIHTPDTDWTKICHIMHNSYKRPQYMLQKYYNIFHNIFKLCKLMKI
jgi:hypothetical protein